MKTILIPASQVSQFWPAIKFATISVDNVQPNNVQDYLTKLLIELLNGTAQCFIRMSDEKKLMGLAVTKLISDELTNEKTLFISCLYSFEGVGSQQWDSDLRKLLAFAKRNKCKKITAYTNNDRVLNLAHSLGFYERFRCISLDLEV